MGCMSSTRNIQQGRNPTKMQQQSPPDITIITLISQLHQTITCQQIPQPQKQTLILKKSNNPNPITNFKKIASYFSYLNLNNSTPTPSLSIDIERELIIVSAYVVANTQYFQCFCNVGVKELNLLGEWVRKENDVRVLDAFVGFVDGMYLEHGVQFYAQAEEIFKAINLKLTEVGSDHVREMGVEILVEMLSHRKSLLKFANEPYHFLEYWLYIINQETQADRQFFWIQSVQKIYQSDINAQEYLFFDNDFRAFIDLLVRVIEGCPDGKALRVPLQCYLALSVTKKMKGNLFRLDDIKGYLQAINAESLGISDLATQIMALN